MRKPRPTSIVSTHFLAIRMRWAHAVHERLHDRGGVRLSGTRATIRW
ncbi:MULTISPECIES: hypothetical protein [unclassified Rhodococcus (in: high G+C Gram-positive bacteria)]